MDNKNKPEKNAEITIRSSAAEYLTYTAATGGNYPKISDSSRGNHSEFPDSSNQRLLKRANGEE